MKLAEWALRACMVGLLVSASPAVGVCSVPDIIEVFQPLVTDGPPRVVSVPYVTPDGRNNGIERVRLTADSNAVLGSHNRRPGNVNLLYAAGVKINVLRNDSPYGYLWDGVMHVELDCSQLQSECLQLFGASRIVAAAKECVLANAGLDRTIKGVRLTVTGTKEVAALSGEYALVNYRHGPRKRLFP